MVFPQGLQWNSSLPPPNNPTAPNFVYIGQKDYILNLQPTIVEIVEDNAMQILNNGIAWMDT